MPTPRQLQLVHVAARRVNLEAPQYRMLLHNVAGVESAKDLDNATFEDVMAVLEDLGFRGGPDADYWRRKVRLRGMYSGPRMVHKIHALAADQRYQLPALCLRFSDHRTDEPEKLYPREAYNLIEMLKVAVDRETSIEDEAPF